MIVNQPPRTKDVYSVPPSGVIHEPPVTFTGIAVKGTTSDNTRDGESMMSWINYGRQLTIASLSFPKNSVLQYLRRRDIPLLHLILCPAVRSGR